MYHRTCLLPALCLVLLAALFAFPVSVFAADEGGKLPLSYTLEDCLRIAERQSPAILAAAEEMKRAKGVIWEVWTSILSVSAKGSYTYFATPPGNTLPANSFGAEFPPRISSWACLPTICTTLR